MISEQCDIGAQSEEGLGPSCEQTSLLLFNYDYSVLIYAFIVTNVYGIFRNNVTKAHRLSMKLGPSYEHSSLLFIY